MVEELSLYSPHTIFNDEQYMFFEFCRNIGYVFCIFTQHKLIQFSNVEAQAERNTIHTTN